MTSLTDRLDAAITSTQDYSQRIRADLDKLLTLPPKQGATSLTTIDRTIAEFDSRVQRLEDDVRNVRGDSKDYYLSEIRDLRTAHGDYLREAHQKRTTVNDNAQHAETAEKVDDTRRDIQQAIDQGNQANRVMGNSMDVLQKDREIIENIDRNLNAVDDEAVSGTVRAKRMIRRAIFHKFLSYIICFLLFFILIVLVGLKGAKKWPGWGESK